MNWDKRKAMVSLLQADMPTSRVPTQEDLDNYNPYDGGSVPRKQIAALTVRQLCEQHPRLRKPIIHGLLRQGETMNIIASPKTGKSWLANDLALCVATGTDWLGIYPVELGEVLIIDNELHGETSANRLPKVAQALGIDLSECGDRIHVANVRGRSLSIPFFGDVLDQFQPGELRLVVVDAFYRALPPDTDENSNGAVANLYNVIDSFAMKFGCSFVLIHHSTKGSQSGKSITDIGAGAGSQSRATDTHLVLRPHAEPGCVVLDAAVRSWPPVEPRVLRWTFPVWQPDPDLDPADLKPDKPPRAKREKSAETPKEPEWTRERFVAEVIGGKDGQPTKGMIIANASDKGMSQYKAEQWLSQCMAKGLLHRWTFGRHDPHQFRTTSQPVLDMPATDEPVLDTPQLRR